MKLRIRKTVVAGLMAGFFICAAVAQETATNSFRTQNKSKDLKCGLVLEKKKSSLPSKKPSSIKGYRHGPWFSYHVEEDGTVTAIKLVRSSGAKGVDRWVEENLAAGHYRARPGCGVIETEVCFIVHFDR